MLVGNRRSTARAEAPSQRVTVSLYEKPPREEMTLEEFEVFAVDRLKVQISVLYLAVPRCCGAFTPSTRVVSRRGGRGWCLFRF